MRRRSPRGHSSPEMTAPRVPAGYRAVVFEEIDSTNEEARRRAVAGERGPLWIMARAQTAGRGRRGREWVSPSGNLMATLLLAPGCPAADAARLSFVAALSVHDALSLWVAPERIRLKWPNDTLLDGRKVSGILLETASSGDAASLAWLAVGIGINLAEAPTIAHYPATCVKDHAPPPNPEAALEALATAWERHFGTWKAQGFAPIREAWLARAAGIGDPIEVRLASETLRGTFTTIDAEGALELLLPDGQRKLVSAGEVFFPEVMR